MECFSTFVRNSGQSINMTNCIKRRICLANLLTYTALLEFQRLLSLKRCFELCPTMNCLIDKLRFTPIDERRLRYTVIIELTNSAWPYKIIQKYTRTDTIKHRLAKEQLKIGSLKSFYGKSGNGRWFINFPAWTKLYKLIVIISR